jgi:aldehyde:ferredoxin oxidoreductase
MDPLGPDNVLTVSAGLLVGTFASASSRGSLK